VNKDKETLRLPIPSAEGWLLSVSFIRKLAEQQNNPKNPVNPACPPIFLEGLIKKIKPLASWRLRGSKWETNKLTTSPSVLPIDAGFRIDMMIQQSVIIENKTVDKIAPIHEAQLLTYLKLTNLKLGFLLNWNVPLMKDGIKRMVNNLKQWFARRAWFFFRSSACPVKFRRTAKRI